MSEKIKFDFSKPEDQTKFDSLPLEEKEKMISESHEEANIIKEKAEKIAENRTKREGGYSFRTKTERGDYRLANEIIEVKERLNKQEQGLTSIEKMKKFFSNPENRILFCYDPQLIFDGYVRHKFGYKNKQHFYETMQRLMVYSEAGNLFELSSEELSQNGFNEQEVSAIGYFRIKMAEILMNIEAGSSDDRGPDSYWGNYLTELIREVNPEILQNAKNLIISKIENQKSKEITLQNENNINSILKNQYNYQGTGDEPEIISGNPESANSYAFGDAMGGLLWKWMQTSGETKQKNKFYNLMIKKIFRDNVVVEIGPSGQWIMEGEMAKKFGASMYVGIDIDERLAGMDIEDEKKDAKNNKMDKMFLVIDDPINFLSKLDDHSVTISSCNVFSEPMRKDLNYSRKLCNLLLQKARFQGHYHDSSPYKFADHESGESFIKLDFINVPNDSEISIYCPGLKEMKKIHREWAKKIVNQNFDPDEFEDEED